MIANVLSFLYEINIERKGFMKNVTELKKEIKKIIPSYYRVKTNFNCSEFLVEYGNNIIMAKEVCTDKKVYYDFVLDTQFNSSGYIVYEDIVITKNIMDVLNQNKELATSKLPKRTVLEYHKALEDSKKNQEQVLLSLKYMFYKNKGLSNKEIEMILEEENGRDN